MNCKLTAHCCLINYHWSGISVRLVGKGLTTSVMLTTTSGCTLQLLVQELQHCDEMLSAHRYGAHERHCADI